MWTEKRIAQAIYPIDSIARVISSCWLRVGANISSDATSLINCTNYLVTSYLILIKNGILKTIKIILPNWKLTFIDLVLRIYPKYGWNKTSINGIICSIEPAHKIHSNFYHFLDIHHTHKNMRLSNRNNEKHMHRPLLVHKNRNMQHKSILLVLEKDLCMSEWIALGHLAEIRDFGDSGISCCAPLRGSWNGMKPFRQRQTDCWPFI